MVAVFQCLPKRFHAKLNLDNISSLLHIKFYQLGIYYDYYSYDDWRDWYWNTQITDANRY